MATVTITPGWAGPLSGVGTSAIVVQVAGVGPPGAAGASGVAPSGTGIVTVTSGVLGTPGQLTGDVTTTGGGLATTLATVNSDVGSFTLASITVDAKGRVTAASSGTASGGTWGGITGTLSAQADLQSALDAKQPLDGDLTSWAAVTRASGFDAFAATPSSANLAALLTDETGTGFVVYSISPALTGSPTITGVVGTGTQSPVLTVTGAAHTALTASTESTGLNLNFSATKQWATGALTTQREVRIQGPTYGFVGASTITEANTLEVKAPTAGTNATITRRNAAVFEGNVRVREVGGTAGTNETQHSHASVTYTITPAPGAGAGQRLDIVCRDKTYSFTDGTNSGFLSTADACLVTAGTSFRAGSTGRVGWSSGPNGAGAIDTAQARAAAQVVELNNGTVGGAGATLRSVPLSPSQITSDQNNFAPGVARYYRLSTDASRTVTGLSVSQVNGQECWVINVGSNSLVLSNQNASSTAANRFLTNTGADITLAANEVAMMVYDSTTSRWRVWKE